MRTFFARLLGSHSTVNINGRTFSGREVLVQNNQVFIDGKPAEGLEPQVPLSIAITGHVELLESATADVTVSGAVGSLTTGSGDIACGDVTGSVSTISGDVQCGAVGGSVSSRSGDVRCPAIAGNASSVSGDVGR